MRNQQATIVRNHATNPLRGGCVVAHGESHDFIWFATKEKK